MISYKDESVTKEEYKEIIKSKIKIEYYKKGGMPRFVNDVPDIVNYRTGVYGPTPSKYNLHKGQHKLYLSEIDFLTDYAKYNTLVIYVGAAPGHHINQLYDDFKHLSLKYHLYDINYFDSDLQTKEKITLFHEYFTEEHCKNYMNDNKNLLFISDIRNMEVLKDATNLVSQDMDMQMNWVTCINPVASMLKFRLPYDSDLQVEYLSGEIRLQAYAPSSTTECRLISKIPYNKKKYDPRNFENRMFYLNKIIRHWNNYDKILEDYILKKYNKFIKNEI